MRPILLALVSLVCVSVASSASAAMFSIVLDDLDGPHIEGVVNTVADTLKVTSWTENPGGVAFWTPQLSQLPLFYTAIDDSAAKFDVPDNFAGDITGVLDITSSTASVLGWGFVADLPNNGISWNEGIYAEAFRHHGWGGGIRLSDGVNVEFFGEQRGQWVPTGSQTFDNAFFETITVTELPEPSTASLLVFGLLAGLAISPARRG